MEGGQKRSISSSSSMAISPSQTPKLLDKFGRSNSESNAGSSSTSKADKDKGVNVQVILRCRPLSDEEARFNTPVVISCNEHRREVSAMQNIANKQIDRTFAFDKVFDPASKQKDLFDQAISPIVNEVLEGYNCTIFAYGQTGTGKTYTMEGGGRKTKNGDFPSDAGVIPRSVRQIFEMLEAQSAEYSMKVTFLELYNEEITDLLAPEESKFSDDKNKKPIALMEDGKGGVFVRGLEEEIVYSAGEIYKILERGSAKRRTAETLLNKQSSRSHSIFSITIHIKEYTHEGEEVIRCGKLNLVDLAGSENISRSGAREGRAREAGEINKSLLTLGRVINALVEHSGHVPYRDSKLTRLLRDSLGGKTKTCIIATISSSIHCLEETLSTLDYAHRAKNIKNRPEVNQKMMKSALIKDLYSEIDRLKQEVYAAREKNGIYIPRDRFLLEEAEKKALTEKLERLESDLESKDKHSTALQELYTAEQQINAELGKKLENAQNKLESTQNALFQLEERYKQAQSTIKEKEYLISNLLKSEKALVECAYDLRAELESAAADVTGLFSKIERKDKVEDGNKVLVQKFRSHLTNQLETLHGTVSQSIIQQETHLREMEEDMKSFVSIKAEATEAMREKIKKLQSKFDSGINLMDGLAAELDKNSKSTFQKLNSQVLAHSAAVEDCFKGVASEADKLLNELQNSICKQEEKLAAFVCQQREGHLRSVETTRSISRITTSFFHTLDNHASKLTETVKETQTVQDQQLHELEKKFEECAAKEESQLIEKVAEMLASSNARKKKLVQEAIHGLRRSAAQRTCDLQEEVSTAQKFTSSVKQEWTLYMEQTENCYHEETAAVESGRSSLEDGFHDCKTKANMGSQQWKDAQNSLLSLENDNVVSMDSIVRLGMETNQLIRSRFSSAASTTLEDADAANKGLLASVNSALELDYDACANLNLKIVPSLNEIRELKSDHSSKVAEITENAERCLEEDYLVDEPSCSTPKKRSINLRSAASIEDLRTTSFEELLKSFWELQSRSRQSNGNVTHCVSDYDSQAHTIKDSRITLPATNGG